MHVYRLMGSRSVLNPYPTVKLTTNRDPALDILRAIAIVSVIAVHCSDEALDLIIPESIYGLGRFGVPLFFFVSGITVSISLSGINKKYTQVLRVFYARRLFRIVPLFLIAIIGYWLYAFHSNHYLTVTGRPLESILSYISPLAGLSIYKSSFVPGGWSIWNELYFYSFLPTYLLIRNKRAGIVLTFLCSYVLMFAIVIANTSTSSFGDLPLQNFFYKSPFNQLCFFILGVEVSYKNLRGMTSLLLAWFPYVIAVLVSGVVLGHPILRFSPLLTPLLIVPITLLYFLTNIFVRNSLSESYLKGNSLWNRLITEISSCSYTAYFLHFLIIDITANTFPAVLKSELYIIFIIIVTLALSRILRPLTEDSFVALGRKTVSAAFH